MTSSLASRADAFMEWWGRELRAASPLRLMSTGIADRTPIIRVRPDGTYIVENHSPLAAPTPGDAAKIAEAITASSALSDATLRLSSADVLTLSFELPERALGRAREILALEIENSTPFSADEASFDFVIAGSAGPGTRSVRQYVVRNSMIAKVVDDFRRQGITIGKVDVEDVADINLLPAGLRTRRGPSLRWEFGLALAALAMLAASAYYRQGRVIEALEIQRASLANETESVRAAAAGANAAAANIEALKKRAEANPSALHTMAALTAALDDSVWLTEMTISGRDIAISGSAASASEALANLDASPAFANAEFSSTVFTDQAKHTEIFSARLRVDTSSVVDSTDGGAK